MKISETGPHREHPLVVRDDSGAAHVRAVDILNSEAGRREIRKSAQMAKHHITKSRSKDN